MYEFPSLDEIDDKTIKPIDIGGEAGGEKYLTQGILFKFATDWHNLYGYNLKSSSLC